VWSWLLFLVLTLCVVEFVWKCSWLFTVKFINENMCSHGRVKISNLLSRLLHEFIVLTPAINVTTVLCIMNIFLLIDELSPQNYSLLHYQVKIGKLNWFDSVSFPNMTHRSNYITCCRWLGVSLSVFGINQKSKNLFSVVGKQSQLISIIVVGFLCKFRL
jgi:hypothetical protein